MPNAFAYLVLLTWPLVAMVLFRTLPLQKAIIWTFLGGYLVLPSATGIDLPLLPDLDKSLVPALSALVLCRIYAPKAQFEHETAGRTGRLVVIALIALLLTMPILTALNNPEPLVFGPTFIPGLKLYDALSMIMMILMVIIPFWIGLRYLNTLQGQRTLLQAFVFAALAYSLPALFEVRMSPQLHVWVYGVFPHDFIHHMRAGGFKPVVFLNHGLLLAIFFCNAVLSALILWREAIREGRTASGWLLAAIWLSIALLLSKNLGALGIAALLAIIVIFTGRRLQVTFAIIVASVVILYPMLRGAGFIPAEAILEVASAIDEDRASSLRFRLDNEDALLAHANAKPVVGWGTWGRNQLYDETTGRMISVTDGIWVILIGVYGWLGYIAHFGLLTLPILFYAVRTHKSDISLITPGLMLVLGASLIDLLPNSGLVNYLWLMAGSLTGYLLWRPVDKNDSSGPAPERGPSSTGFGAKAPAAQWVMASKVSTTRRPRTKRQELSE